MRSSRADVCDKRARITATLLTLQGQEEQMITSTGNQQMKNIALLQKKAKARNEQETFIVEGRKMFGEMPREWLKKVYVTEQAAEETDLSGVDYEVVADAVFKSISDTQTPQGILSLVRMPHYELSDLLAGENTNLLVLESIQDPGNLGTMLRTGEGAGITGVVMNRNTVDLFNPKTIRSTMGSIYRVPFYVSENLPETVQTLREAGVTLFAAHLRGKASYDKMDYKRACGFLIGNEGNGLSDELADLADAYVRIPMEGKVESLNAAIAASLLVYEVHRQRQD